VVFIVINFAIVDTVKIREKKSVAPAVAVPLETLVLALAISLFFQLVL
jgi:hypothetical protein